MNIQPAVTRRLFLKTVAAAGITASGLAAIANAKTNKPNPTGQKLKVGLIGCGRRGNGALHDCKQAAAHLDIALELVATADVFADKALHTGKANGVPAARCFSGFDAYQKVLAAGVDIVILATAPSFRPLHLEAAIAAGKHVFMEKPVAVDPPGARRVIAAGELAKQKGLSIVAGTQRRHDANYQRTQAAVAAGAIGRIVGGTVSWCGGRLWFETREPGESDAHYMVHNWVSFTEMSGDHIVEQHVHNLDVANWFIGHPPVAALGFGSRARRQTGNQFDFFSVDFDYGDGCHIHSMCRQVNDTYSRVGEFFTGTEGTTNGNGGLKTEKKVEMPAIQVVSGNPYVEEHVVLLRAMTKGPPVNEAQPVAEATLAAIMGRISAYTGQLVRWSDVTKNADSPWYNFTLRPAAADFETGHVVAPKDNVIAIPGTA